MRELSDPFSNRNRLHLFEKVPIALNFEDHLLNLVPVPTFEENTVAPDINMLDSLPSSEDARAARSNRLLPQYGMRSRKYRIFWFLPALLSLTVLRSAHYSSGRFSRAAIQLVALVTLAAGSLVPVPLRPYLWFGWGVAFYLFPLGQLVEKGWKLRARMGPSFDLASFAIFMGCAAFILHDGSYVNLGKFIVYGVDTPMLWAIHLAIPVAACLCGLAADGALARVPSVVVLGRYSLVIYLSHSFFHQAFTRLAESAGLPDSVLLAVLDLAITIVGGLVVARIIERARLLHRFLTPRDWRELSGQI